MRVLLLNTFPKSGGAAVAANRLACALKNKGVAVEFGSFYPDGQIKPSMASGWRNKLRFILDRLAVKIRIADKSFLYRFSGDYVGLDITRTPQYHQADIVHLHWVNFGFMNSQMVAKIAAEKPVFWTLHDMWAFTGGCHYALDCELYQSSCNQCMYLKNSSWSAQIQVNKLKRWRNVQLNIIACSNWLADRARSSKVLQDHSIQAIGNTLDFDLYHKKDQLALRTKYKLKQDTYYVLCGAMDLKDERKGFDRLVRSLKLVAQSDKPIELLTFGKTPDLELPIPITSFGQINNEEELVDIYNLADIFVLPSIQDNLPNTVMEAMACGLPVVTFSSGGVVDMVDHLKTGYIAENKNTEDLARGILHFAEVALRKEASMLARELIVSRFNPDVIASKYLEAYQSILIK